MHQCFSYSLKHERHQKKRSGPEKRYVDQWTFNLLHFITTQCVAPSEKNRHGNRETGHASNSIRLDPMVTGVRGAPGPAQASIRETIFYLALSTFICTRGSGVQTKRVPKCNPPNHLFYFSNHFGKVSPRFKTSLVTCRFLADRRPLFLVRGVHFAW